MACSALRMLLFRDACPIEQQQVLASQQTLLLRMPPHGRAQRGVLSREPQDCGSQVSTGAGSVGRDRDLVQDVTVCGVERVTTALRLSRHYRRGYADGAASEGRVRGLTFDEPVERSAIRPRHVLSLSG